jgi:hypothetical protein
VKKKSNNEYQCPYCSQTSTRKYNIQVHIERKHSYSKQSNPQINNTNEYPLYDHSPFHNLTEIETYPSTWKTPMDQYSSSTFFSSPPFPFYPASFFYDAIEKYEKHKRRESERSYNKTVLEYIQNIVIPSLKLQNTQFNNSTDRIFYSPIIIDPVNKPKAHKIYKCHKCFIPTLEPFFDFQEIQPTNKFIHSCSLNQQQQKHHKDNNCQIQTSKLQELLLSVIDIRLKSEDKLLLKMIVFPDFYIENALSLKILIDLMENIGNIKYPFRWLFELVENDGFIDLGEIKNSDHWIKRAFDCSSTEEKVSKLEKEELKQFISITEGTFGLIKFRIDKKIIYTFCYLPLDDEKITRQEEEEVSCRFSEFAEQLVVTAATTPPPTTTTPTLTTAAATTTAAEEKEEESQQTESVDQSLIQIDEQQVGRNSEGENEEDFAQYIQQLAADPGMQQIIASKNKRSYSVFFNDGQID